MQQCREADELVIDERSPLTQLLARDVSPQPDERRKAPSKSTFSHAVKKVLVRSGVVALARRMPAPEECATILRYHSVSASANYCSPTIAVSPELFERQMSFLARNYIVFPLGELLTRFARRELPKGSVAITFDDGYLDNATEALPILARYGLTATFFVTSDSVLGKGGFWVGWLYRAVATASDAHLSKACQALTGTTTTGASRDACFAALATLVDNARCSVRQNYFSELERLFPAMPPMELPSDFMMTVDDLRELHQAGMTIGAHTATHRVLAGLERRVVYDELSRSKADLEAALDNAVDHLAYPNGHVSNNVDEAAINVAGELGYVSAGTSRRGILTKSSSYLDLPRQGVNEMLGFEGFVFKLEEARFSRLLQR
ncbi:polysaccharide deacetylase family protein [Microvirga terrestris]|uniref:Chitooligosaccharide deacetylase n=1 Tax=Microvirga terrestris TaxID=2791024 RepID=A0ABS0HW13_9HYPH|nr:polysaccharide deacetylase family protein [Microvirga terrestris]MBF9197544.1 polysaccharide deacetylase family protein [Microvirga terrestris]